MSDQESNRVFLSQEEATAMLPDGEYIHTFRGGGMTLLGAEWDRQDIIDAFGKYKLELSGDIATSMGHGVCFIDNHGAVFVETKKQVTK